MGFPQGRGEKMEPVLSITFWLLSQPRHISGNSGWKTGLPVHPEIPPSYLLMSSIPPLLGVPKPHPTFLRPPHHCCNKHVAQIILQLLQKRWGWVPPPFIKHSPPHQQLLDWLLWNNLNVHSPFEGQVLGQQLCSTRCCLNYSWLATCESFIIKLLMCSA